ncbi:MAG: NAD-dependent epimerase/dehydratase family protein, partial [Sphingobacteriia bacterium]|nr:NAD-dependent epimerase/dehydratase family protein [Sphingobacteriia bacterium]
MKKILITGTSGFIGGALYRELSDSYQVSTFNESDIIFNWKERLSDLISEVSCVIHIGAISSTTEANINKVMELNYEFSKFVFSQASENDISVIFSSSAAIYGPHEGEDCPKNIYGWSKKLCEDYGLLVLKKFIALRYFNVYGPGEQHKGKSASVAYQAFLHKKSSGEPFPLFSG